MIEYTLEDITTECTDGNIALGTFLSGVTVKFICSEKDGYRNIDDVAKISVLCELIKTIVNNDIPINVIMDYRKQKKRGKK